MIDAYTIGITLALEDGVSEGILQIRHDLASLDTAVAESAARLAMLRKLAEDVGLTLPADRTVKRAALFSPLNSLARTTPAPAAANEPAVTAPTESPLPSSISPAAASQNPPPIIAPAAQTIAPSPRSDRLPVADSHAPQSPLRQAPVAATPAAERAMAPSTIVVPAAMPAPAAPAAPPASPRQERPAVAQAVPVEAPDFSAFARSLLPSALPVPPNQPGTPERLAPAPAPSEMLAPRTTAAPIVSETRPPAVPQSQAPALLAPAMPKPNLDRPQGWSPPTIPSTPEQGPPNAPPASRLSAAPTVPVAITLARPPVSSVEPSRPSLMAARDEQKVEPPASAELHLDGAALGRWVTRHLEREVTRPQAGTTGFDPRMSPSWAGAPIGN